jgi:hypothetical protein
VCSTRDRKCFAIYAGKERKKKMPEKVVLAYEEGVVVDFLREMLDVLNKFDPDELKAWVRETYPDPDEVYE